MKPWKPIALIVPAGLLLGMAAGAATRPVMIQRAQDPWPAAVAERQARVEPPRPFYEGGPQDLTPASYSYRPHLDYSALSWPDQQMPEYPAATADYTIEQPQVAEALPAVHRGTAQLAGERAEQAVEDALIAAVDVEMPEPEPTEVAAVELPAVPPPVKPMETEAF